jgi:hypothetical protein
MHAGKVLVALLGLHRQPAPPQRLELGRRGLVGSAFFALPILPRASLALTNVETLTTQQTARARYGPRILVLRDTIGVGGAAVRESVQSEAAVHLFTSGAFLRGTERAAKLEALERELSSAAEVNDAARTRLALDNIIEVGGIRYNYASTGDAIGPSALPTPKKALPSGV